MNADELDNFLDMVDQAIFEMDGLLAIAEDESEMEGGFSGMSPVYQQISAELKKLHASAKAETFSFSGHDLPYVELVRKWKTQIPVSGLLEAINEAQKRSVT